MPFTDGGGGLEEAAAEAALEAEALALEAKAEAEQRAVMAESKVAELEVALAAFEAKGDDLLPTPGGFRSAASLLALFGEESRAAPSLRVFEVEALGASVVGHASIAQRSALLSP